MTTRDRVLINFRPSADRFLASMPLEDVANNDFDPEEVLRTASITYGQYIARMRLLLNEIAEHKGRRVPIPARKVWVLGNVIFELVRSLEESSLEIDGLYTHLMRDLGVKRMWLEKVIILRRYVPSENLIPPDLNWGKIMDAPRKAAKELLRQ